ncbi:translocation/assembly module TamB domain-containing protein [Roseicitreum antarcticum]|uniref:Autotransporter secretion inner membrane protein TamB n=1 Tax=Roseicitreum antarcticum TaxID=564137 RepID=A0A1H2RMB4_9RHOB|nr:translocation/assembly module TamB domain-containing protein [Roseicitreum antarcticum]SDW20445.1 autotransporter secretion inner membrane protein TamB [Roseicitreum antarcticum]
MRFLKVLWLSMVMFAAASLPASAQSDEGGDVGFIASFLQDNLSDAGRDVRIRGFAGAISSRATIEEMTIADDDGIWLTLRDVALQWNRSALLRGRIDIGELTAGEVIVARPPATADAPPSAEARVPFALPDLPVSLDIGQLSVGRLELAEPVLGFAVEMRINGSASLEGGEGLAQLSINRIDGPRGAIELRGGFSNETRVLDLNLSVAEGPDGIAATLLGIPDRPSVELSVEGQGPIDDFAADIALGTDGQDRVTGQVAFVATEGDAGAQRFSVDIAGDLRPLMVSEYHDFFGDRSRVAATGARLANGRLDLSELTVATRMVQLSGRASIDPDGLPDLIDLRGTLASEDGSPVLLPVPGAQVTVGRAGLVVEFDAVESPDWVLDFDIADLNHPAMQIDRLVLSGIGQISRAGDGSGRDVVDAVLDYSATGLSPTDPALAEALGAAIDGSASFIWRDGDALDLPGFVLEGSDFRVSGQGALADGDFDGAFELDLTDLTRFSGLAGRPLGGALTGDVTGSVTPLTGGFDLEATVVGQSLRAGIEEVDNLLSGESQIFASVRRGEDGISLRNFTAEARTLRADAAGTIRTDDIALDATVRLSDASVLGDAYGGSVQADAAIRSLDGRDTVTFTAEAVDLSVGQAELDRALLGVTTVEAEVVREGDLITLNNAIIRGGAVQADASGTIRPGDIALDAAVRMPDLSVLGPAYGGAVRADVQIAQTAGTDTLTLTAEARDVTIGQPDLDRALSGVATVRADVTRRDGVVSVERLTVNNPLLDASGTGRLAPDGALSGALDFSVTDLARVRPGFGGTIAGAVEVNGDGTTNRVGLEVTAQSLRVGQAQANSLLAGESRLTVDAVQTGERIRVESANLSNPQLSLRTTASIEGAVRRLTVDGQINSMALIVPGFAGALRLSGDIEDTAAGYLVDLDAQGPGGIDMALDGQVSRDLRADLRISGVADLSVANPFLEPNVLRGPVRIDMGLNGPLALSSLSGVATVQDASLVLPGARQRVEDISARVSLGGAQADVQLDGRFARGGTLGVAGQIGLAGARQADLRVALTELRVVNPQLFETAISGNLSLTGPLTTGPRATGTLTLTETELRIPSSGLGGAGFVLDGVRHINDRPGAQVTRERAGILRGTANGGTPVPLYLDITLDAPNRIFVRGRGLDAELGGSLRLQGTTRDIIPSGQFGLIRGRLDLLGNRFTLSEGFANLQGQFVPFVRLVATTDSGGVTTSIILEGLATEPEIRFTSVPELPEEEVVSRLIFGRDLGSLSAFQAAQLASALATLSGRSSGGLLSNLRDSFGLDDLDVTTDSDGTAALRAGRYITENIYTDVVVDSQGGSEVSVNLDLTSDITVRARTAGDGKSGLGVFFERDY